MYLNSRIRPVIDWLARPTGSQYAGMVALQTLRYCIDWKPEAHQGPGGAGIRTTQDYSGASAARLISTARQVIFVIINDSLYETALLWFPVMYRRHIGTCCFPLLQWYNTDSSAHPSCLSLFSHGKLLSCKIST